MIRTRYVAVLSLLFTVFFFIEYTPLFRRVHIPFDLEEFQYPLFDYAFQALHQGRFPQWDPTIYSGLSFAGNTQAALFYPPTWLMFACSWGRARLSYQSVQDLALAHVWLAFLLCYLWLRSQRGLGALASALGAGVFAFSGYMLLQLQHFGLIAGYAWMPLGFSAIDAADQSVIFGARSWRTLWKLAAASALCFLAGYPPMWIVFAICMLAYAGGRKSALRCAPAVACALAASLLLAAVQLLPAWEATRLAVPEARYGSYTGIEVLDFFISYVAPNYFDFGLDVPVHTNPGKEYLYLGAAAIAGITLLLRRRFDGLGPPGAVLLASLLFLINPFGLVGSLIERSTLLSQVFSAWYFLAGLTASLALLSAIGIDESLRRSITPAPRWLAVAAIALSLAWSIRLLAVWMAGGGGFAVRWLSAVDAAVAALLLGLLILLHPGSRGWLRAGTGVAALLLAAADYKAFGTSKRFNANRGPGSANYIAQPFPGLNTAVYESLRSHPEYRLALDITGPFPQNLRHNGLSTPQGFDPLLPMQYKTLVDRIGHFRTNREFEFNPEDEKYLRLLGVRYFVSARNGPYVGLRLLEPADTYFKVFEYVDPRPAYGWEEQDAEHTAEMKIWQPERRAFAVRSTGGHFRLSEQFYPGWTATVDNMETKIERCQEAFQCVTLTPGEHQIEFRYDSRWLFIGAAISLCSMLALVVFLFI